MTPSSLRRLAFTLALVLISSTAAAEKPLIENLAWLAGSWHSTQTDGGEGEQVWLPPRDGAMFGVFRFLRKGQLQFSEHLIIRSDAKGMSLTIRRFDAQSAPISAQKGGLERYIVTRATRRETNFESLNAKLAKVSYLHKKGALIVRVTPNVGSKARPVEFRYDKKR